MTNATSPPATVSAMAPSCRAIVMFHPKDHPSGDVLVWRDFLEHGRNVAADGDQRFRATALEAKPDDEATILYTSGTTGNPKGVILTHNNLSSNVKAAQSVLPPVKGDTSLVFLPLSHVLQRMVSFFKAHFCINTLTPLNYNKSMPVAALFESQIV